MTGQQTHSTFEHYRQLGVPIQNLDDETTFHAFEKAIKGPRNRNFFVDFSDDEAWCERDLSNTQISRLLKGSRSPNTHTRWINIWNPYKQTDIVQTIARYYDFTPRLLGVMRSAPVQPKKAAPVKDTHSHLSSSSILRRLHGEKGSSAKSMLEESSSIDLEDSAEMKELAPASQFDSSAGINHYHIANEVWHWSSVDWGRRYVSLGYNSLYHLDTSKKKNINDDGEEVDEYEKSDVPEGKRVWSWLVLCEDKTVISIMEDPYPFTKELDEQEIKSLSTIRRNIINVFSQLSKAYDSKKANPLNLLPIRKRVGDSEEETIHRETDIPGLLFYCLFDDWHTTYSLLARQEHPYASKLNKLREEMLQTASLSHIEQLHYIGRQLSVLKRIYQSYELIIDRVLEKQEASLASLKNSHIVSSPESLESSTADGRAHQILEHQSLLGVSISSAARVRFERLKHRIRLYALSEIQECIDQKESLVMMNFNLIAIKESYSVERLTRVTLFLAKITILFMPVSLMTAYFSTEIEGVTFKLNEYWIAFAVILTLSVIVLIVFGVVSGTMESKILYKPWSRIFWDKGKKVYNRKRKGM
ncbi:hypothetical protein M501DRAFT_927945 [Patellaria atrata CBS 101060]|uniref:Uncharacterized protein n=1 Tax=Patellaria atrata CBS 101060 TaxID=1346257 RepID=A0A9P4SGX7_9PEZI|nr:hypothetical protein M501DRAFT_927945 [Patellaria atrata CBS 101060]